MDEFTASSIAVDQDKIEAEAQEKRKGDVDYTKLEADVAASRVLAEKGNLSEALESLLNLEKRQRSAEDVTGSKIAVTAILDVLFQAKDWKALNEHIILLAKRRSQLKQVVQSFVKQALGYVDQTPDKETKIELIKTLQSVTEGKIFVEIERARLTKRLAKLKEEEGNIDEAADILQEVAVETFGAMAKTEKIYYILEQVRLCLDRKDFVRAQIIAKKVTPKSLLDTGKSGVSAGEVGIEGTIIENAEEGTPSLAELRLLYHQLLIRYHAHNNNYLEICRCYKSIYEIESIAADPAKWQPVLKKICWFVVLAATSSDQITLLTNTAADKKLEQLPLYKELLDTFINKEVVWWTVLSEKFKLEVEEQAEVFSGEHGPKRHEDFRLRVIEHNVIVVSTYYSRISTARLAELLDLSADEAERHLADMVVAKTVSAKIDRPAGIVRFLLAREPDELLNSWSSSIGKLLELTERSCQQIQKESMIHKVPIGAQG